MSQFGMQMPAARSRRGSSPDVYSALMVVATVFLVAACIVMWFAGGKVGKGGNAFGIQDAANVELPALPK